MNFTGLSVEFIGLHWCKDFYLMNFYFCETCGKRLTEQDLAQGLGRDKKLKGVFCKDCAVGVMTLETLPLTDEEAKKVLARALNDTASASLHNAGRPGAVSSPRRIERATQAPSPRQRSGIWFRVGLASLSLLAIALVLSALKRKSENDGNTIAAKTLEQRRIEPPSGPAEVIAKPPNPPILPTPISQAPATTEPTPDPAPAIAIPEPSPTKPEPGESQPAPNPSILQSPPEPAASPAPPAFLYEGALELALGAATLNETRDRMVKEGKPEKVDERWKVLEDAVGKAAAFEDAVWKGIMARSGEETMITTTDGIRRRIKWLGSGAQGMKWDLGGAERPVRLDELAVISLEELARGGKEESKDREAQMAAYQLLRGNPALAKRLIPKITSGSPEILEGILEARGAVARESAAAADISKFRDLYSSFKRDAAASLGRKILNAHEGTRAFAEARAEVEAKLADIQSGGIDLKGIFFCDARRLPDGRMEILFERSKPGHLMELVVRGFPARFSEVEADFQFDGLDSAEPFLQAGDTTFHHQSNKGQTITHLGKLYSISHAIPSGGARRYRIRAGPGGVSFQVDEGPAQIAPGPWEGGRLKWAGGLIFSPVRVSLTGKVDPLWLAEMADVAKDRAKFASGAWVEPKPLKRPIPSIELEPSYSYYYGRANEHRELLGWNEIGLGWTVEGKEWVSPSGANRRRWVSGISPQALVSRNAELAFEVRLDKGFLDIALDDKHALTVESGGVKFQRMHRFFSSSSDTRLFPTVLAQAAHSFSPGQWLKCQVLSEKNAVKFGVEGVSLLNCKHAAQGGPMVLFVYPDSAVRLRNVKIRKLD